MNDVKDSVVPNYELGLPLDSNGVSEVVESKNDQFPVGSVVTGTTGWENYTVVGAQNDLNFIPNARESKLPLSNYIGVLGTPGLTAYGGLLKYGSPKAGETLFVSSAFGAVGQLVGQISKRLGLRVVGSAGSDAKVEYLIKELKFDAAFNYKKASSIRDALHEAAPEGIDIYFDNVGGETFEAALDEMKTFGRVLVCGMMSQYSTDVAYGIRNMIQVLVKRLRIEGFMVYDYAEEYRAKHQKDVSSWLLNKEFVYKEDITDGLDNAPDAFVNMLTGNVFGKVIVKIADL